MAHTATAHGENYLNHSKGLWSWLKTLDHKRIGLMYLYTVLSYFLLGGLFALAIRMKLMFPGQTFMDLNTYNKFFTFHGAIMVFMVIIPAIPAALGNFVLPMMLGAKDVAFPRLNLASYYIYVLGALIASSALFLGGADTGWTFYTPYSIRTSGAVIAVLFGAFVMGFSSILTGLNFIVTIHKLRAPGLTWARLPLFIWASYATSIIQILATPVLAITLLLLVFERLFHVGIFDPKLGGDPVLFQHFFWFYSHPAVYIMILPPMGVISEVIPVFSRKPIFGYKAIAYSSFGIALIAFIVWGHHLFVSGQGELANFVFSLLTMLVAVPTGVKVFSWVGTMYKGSIRLNAPMLYALGFLQLFTIGGLTGVFLATLAIDVHLTDTYFVIAHFHYVMVGGALMGLLAGMHYWFPKMTGRMYLEKGAGRAFWMILIGFNITFFPQFIAGAQGMPRRYADYLPEFATMNLISTVGSWFLAIGFFWAGINLLRSLKLGEKAGDNPWHALTLEWQSPSPPPHDNFVVQPIVKTWPYDYKPEAGLTPIRDWS
ncbi:MAG: cytochrome c oxidase subunit I [Bdellovibrionales bacterium]|nr:cytochrome c oxidase subunit I [Bdellovibrionales bacterium]